jgi:hypothetical protein
VLLSVARTQVERALLPTLHAPEPSGGKFNNTTQQPSRQNGAPRRSTTPELRGC